MVPKKLRKPGVEEVIKKRLKNHFERHARKIKLQNKKILRNGSIFTASGIGIMLVATFVLFGYSQTNIFNHFLTILFEPAGWFLFWEGLDQVVFESKKTGPELEFYEKMAKSDINFISC